MKKKETIHIHPLKEPITNGDTQALSKAISLMESELEAHLKSAEQLLDQLKVLQTNSIRIAVSGVPGVGKSTFIEALGVLLTKKGTKVAVLTIDPSSAQSGGSILGDKTRMEKLSRSPLAYIRTTPAAAALGGVAKNTRASIKLCEAAGFEVIFIETVGVGQSELEVHEMVDFFLLLKLPGAGDEIQGIKRGIMEVADALLINKADGASAALAKRAQQFFKAALHAFPNRNNGWEPPVLLASATEGIGIEEIWHQILAFIKLQKENAAFEPNRQAQEIIGWRGQLAYQLYKAFLKDPNIGILLPKLENAIKKGEISPAKATKEIITQFRQPIK